MFTLTRNGQSIVVISFVDPTETENLVKDCETLEEVESYLTSEDVEYMRLEEDSETSSND
jgi:hypothetical protein